MLPATSLEAFYIIVGEFSHIGRGEMPLMIICIDLGNILGRRESGDTIVNKHDIKSYCSWHAVFNASYMWGDRGRGNALGIWGTYLEKLSIGENNINKDLFASRE